MAEEELHEAGGMKSDSESSDAETRSMVRDQNRKKKKSGGFQAMGMLRDIQ